MRKIKIGIVGATGLVGRTMLKLLDEYQIEYDELRLFASLKSSGKVLHYKNSDYIIHEIDDDGFKGLDYVLFATPEEVSKLYVPYALKEKAIVIDNSSAFRKKNEIPLIIPEINIEKAYNQRLISNPNCSTIQCCVALNPLKKYGIKSIIYNTYQSVSGAGHKGINDLARCRKGLMPLYFKLDVACTCIPLIGSLLDNNFSTEEEKMIFETKKILSLSEKVHIVSTCVRVPIMFGHGVSVMVSFEKEFSIEQIKEDLKDAPGVVLCENALPSSVLATLNDYVYVGRIRKDKESNSLLFYCVADNIRKGAASNAVETLKMLLEREC